MEPLSRQKGEHSSGVSPAANLVDAAAAALTRTLGPPIGDRYEWDWPGQGTIRLSARDNVLFVCFGREQCGALNSKEAQARPLVFTELRSPQQAALLAEYCATGGPCPPPPRP